VQAAEEVARQCVVAQRRLVAAQETQRVTPNLTRRRARGLVTSGVGLVNGLVRQLERFARIGDQPRPRTL
jgi:hypothetical protein